jgi:MEMO1 family protein
MDHMSVLRRPLGASRACGWVAVADLVIETRRRFRLALCNSGNTAGSRDRVAGYGAGTFGQAA